MRRTAASVVVLAMVLALGSPAWARGTDGLKTATMGMTQWPADLFIHLISPPEDFKDELPAGVVTAHILGAVTGPLLGAYRLLMGAGDLALFPFWIFPVLSPEPRWEWFKDIEYD